MIDTNRHTLFSNWVNEHGDALYSWAYHKTSNEAIAQDLVQDTFVSAYQNLDTFKKESSPKTWLFSILKNKIIDHYRKQARSIMTTIDAPDETAAWFDGNNRWKIEHRPKPWDVASENLLDDIEFQSSLSYCMDKLPAAWHACMELKYLAEKDSGEVCQELNITASNLWQMVHRAKLQLRKCLESNWFKKQ